MPAIVHASLDTIGGDVVVTGWEDERVFHLWQPPPRTFPTGIRFRGAVCQASPGIDAEAAHKLAAAEIGSGSETAICVIAEGTVPLRAYISVRGQVEEAELHAMPTRSDLYSRSKGLLEGELLAPKSVLVLGLGSFGSLVAVELAKAGVGHFVLIDFDRVACENLARHVCGIDDLGRMKTHAVRDAIWQKNPFAAIRTLEADINGELENFRRLAAESDLIICVTDENRSRLNANQACVDLKKPGLFARAITRAAGGDVFRLRPGAGACLNCLFGAGLFDSVREEVSSASQVRRVAPAYADPLEIEATVQVGLSSDIVPITNMVVKLALVELSRGLPSGLASLDEDLSADFYIWANRRDESYAGWPPMGCYFNRNSVLRWYGAEVPKDPACLICNRTLRPVDSHAHPG